MKKTYQHLLCRTFGISIFMLFFTFTSLAYPTGAPAAVTGSPGDGQNCTMCHGGSPATVTGWITTNIPADGYIAGTLYTITATVTGTGKKGFEVSPQNVAGTQLGVMAAGSGSELVGGTKYVTHSAAGATSGTKVWNFSWTAPAAGTGPVTFYGAFVVGYSNVKKSSLTVNEASANPLAATASATPGNICLGSSSQLSVNPSGGSGTYTYSWTSVPAGFTSSLQNPVVTPTENTQYNVSVSDGSQSVSASASVSVNQPATAFAGNDMTYPYETTEVLLNGTATNYASIHWTSSGTGTFSGNTLNASYYPSIADLDSQSVTLSLTATAVSPCSTDAVDNLLLTFALPNGISDHNQRNFQISMYPNPTHGLVTLQLDDIEANEAKLSIIDLSGRTVYEKVIFVADSHSNQIDLSANPKGIYFVKVLTNKGISVRRLILD